MNKAFVLLGAILIAGCGKPAASPQADNAAACDMVYDHILDLEVAENAPIDSNLPKDTADFARDYAKRTIDDEMRKNGTSEKFFGFCMHKMTTAQMNCAMAVGTIDALDSCVKFD